MPFIRVTAGCATLILSKRLVVAGSLLSPSCKRLINTPAVMVGLNSSTSHASRRRGRLRVLVRQLLGLLVNVDETAGRPRLGWTLCNALAHALSPPSNSSPLTDPEQYDPASFVNSVSPAQGLDFIISMHPRRRRVTC